MNDQKRLLTVKEFCHRYGISRSKFFLLLQENLARPIIRIGRRVYIAVDDAEAWVATHRIKPVAA